MDKQDQTKSSFSYGNLNIQKYPGGMARCVHINDVSSRISTLSIRLPILMIQLILGITALQVRSVNTFRSFNVAIVSAVQTLSLETTDTCVIVTI